MLIQLRRVYQDSVTHLLCTRDWYRETLSICSQRFLYCLIPFHAAERQRNMSKFIVCAYNNGAHSEFVFEDYQGFPNYTDAAQAYLESGGTAESIYSIYQVLFKDEEEEQEDDEDDDYAYDHNDDTDDETEDDSVKSEPVPTEIGRVLKWHTLGMDVYLNVYIVHQHYGGPEEGGWWYNSWSPARDSSKKVRFNEGPGVYYRDHYEVPAKTLLAEFEEECGYHRSASSAAGDGFDVHVQIEMCPGKSGNNHSPWC